MDTMEIEVDLCLASKRPLEPAETDWRLMEPKWRLPSGGRLRPERVSRATWWLKSGPRTCAGFLAKGGKEETRALTPERP